MFPLWKQKQLSRNLAQDGLTGMGYSNEFVWIFSGRERLQVLGEWLLSQTQLLHQGAQEAGDTPIHEGGGQESRGAGEAPERL